MKTLITVLSAIIIMAIFTNYAYAGTLPSETLSMVGIDLTYNRIDIFIPSGSVSNPDGCSANVIIWTDANTKSMALSVAMAAVISKHTVNIGYTQDSNTKACTGTSILLNP